MNLLHIRQLQVTVGERALIRNLDLEVATGEFLGLIGPNGAGKSSLLKAIAQLLPYQGDMQLAGQSLAALPPEQRARQLAYVSQEHHWQWPLSVRDLVSLGRYPHRHSKQQSADDEAVTWALTQCQLLALQQRRLDSLSGGESARVKLARALAVDAPLLLADEPIAGLDPFHQLQVMQLLQEQCRRGKTVLLVLHDLTLASRFCERLALLHQGQLLACGHPRQVLTPKHLQQAYQVQVVTGQHQEEAYVLPWACFTSNERQTESA